MPDPCDGCNELSCVGCSMWDNDPAVDNYDDIINQFYNDDPDLDDQGAAAEADALAAGLL